MGFFLNFEQLFFKKISFFVKKVVKFSQPFQQGAFYPYAFLDPLTRSKRLVVVRFGCSSTALNEGGTNTKHFEKHLTFIGKNPPTPHPIGWGVQNQIPRVRARSVEQ